MSANACGAENTPLRARSSANALCQRTLRDRGANRQQAFCLPGCLVPPAAAAAQPVRTIPPFPTATAPACHTFAAPRFSHAHLTLRHYPYTPRFSHFNLHAALPASTPRITSPLRTRARVGRRCKTTGTGRAGHCSFLHQHRPTARSSWRGRRRLLRRDNICHHPAFCNKDVEVLIEGGGGTTSQLLTLLPSAPPSREQRNLHFLLSSHPYLFSLE